MGVSDEYLREVIGKGDEGSRLLAKLCAPTLQNSDFTDVVREGMNGITVLRLPEDHLAMVHSVGGDPNERNPARYATSLVERLVEGARKQGATPIAIADDINASNIDLGVIRETGKALAKAARKYGIAIVNGELAALGDRVVGPLNITGTMLSIVPKNTGSPTLHRALGRFKHGEFTYASFDHEGMPVYMNSDGVGTKLEFAERRGVFAPSLRDSVAMKADDAVKLGAIVRVMSDVVETNERDYGRELDQEANRLGSNFGFDYILHHEKVGGRIRSYRGGIPAINIGGSAVSVIDEKVLANLPKPSAGEALIAIRGKPNPRSNGITDKRKAMIEMMGIDWHTTKDGDRFMEFLGEPSTVFYGLFTELKQAALATSFYHMSGGAFNGKLAKPLAKHNLFVEARDLFPADWREYALAGKRFTPAEVAYGKCSMENDGFVTSRVPGNAMAFIRNRGLECRVVGTLQTARRGRTGVELVEITGSDGKNVYYSGKK